MLALLALIVACGGDDEPEPEPEPQVVETVASLEEDEPDEETSSGDDQAGLR